ncbi:MAG: hypothetical protein HYZ54_03820 [Ignavibacteriae bacterium]|nr:hypothetical protein [Ignavibacteriota bacterium]
MITTTELPPLPSFAILATMSEEERHETEADFLLDEAYRNIAERNSIDLSESYKELLFAFRIRISQRFMEEKLDIQEINTEALHWIETHHNNISKELVERLSYSVKIMGIVSQYIMTNFLKNSQYDNNSYRLANPPSYQDAISDVESLPENIKRYLYALFDSSLWIEFIQLGYISSILRNKLLAQTRQTALINLLKKHTSTYKRCANLLFRIKGLPKLERDITEWKEFIAETLGSISDESAFPDRNWTFTERINIE